MNAIGADIDLSGLETLGVGVGISNAIVGDKRK